MNEHPIEGLMTSVMENLKKVVDANTVIGEPINLPNGTSIIPVTKLSCGFGAGGGEYGKNTGNVKLPFGGGTGGGISVQPLGFISCTANDVRFVHIDDASPAGNVDAIAESIIKLVKGLSDRKKNKEEEITVDAIEDAEEAAEA